MKSQIPGMGSGHRDPARTSTATVERPPREELLVIAFRSNRHRMYSIARGLCGDEEAADVVQEVFLRLWRDDHFDPARSSLDSYLNMLTRSVAIDHIRQIAARRLRDERDIHRDRPVFEDADRRLLNEHTRDRVSTALEALNDRERQVIETAFFQHLTYREVARRLGIPEGTVKSRARLAMIKLRHDLREFAM